MLLPLLVFAGCGQQPKQETSQPISDHKPLVAKAGADEKLAPEQFDIGEIEEAPPAELDIEPTLESPAQFAQEAENEYYDDSKVFEHRGGGVASGVKDMGSSGGAVAFGRSPKLAGAAGSGMGLGTGTTHGRAATSFAGRGSGHRRAMLGQNDGSEFSNQGATAMGLLPFLASGDKSMGNRKMPSTQPFETWKPAHVVPNTSRLMVGEREELPLKGMQVDVRVDGFRARVLIDLYYFNDRPQQLEGNFQLRLPDEASPYFFAFGRTVYQAPQITLQDSMFFKPQQVSQGDTTPEKILALRGNSWEQPKVARMVPREKAAFAYRETVRRRVDPALVEWSGAGVFQCRVFPLAPQSMHRVTIGYDIDLVPVGEDLELRLDLPGQTPATIVDLNIATSDARQVSLEGPLSLRERARVRAAGDAVVTLDSSLGATNPGANAPGSPANVPGSPSRLSYRLIDPKDSPLAVRLRKPGTQMLTGSDEATGSYFATRVGLTLLEAPAAARAKQAIFLVDTSLSAGGVGRGVPPRPQPQTGRASFQASGFPDNSTLM